MGDDDGRLVENCAAFGLGPLGGQIFRPKVSKALFVVGIGKNAKNFNSKIIHISFAPVRWTVFSVSSKNPFIMVLFLSMLAFLVVKMLAI